MNKLVIVIPMLFSITLSSIGKNQNISSNIKMDPIRLVLLKEVINGKEEGCYRFGESGKIIADVHATLRIDIDEDLAKSLGIKKAEVNSVINGPVGVKPIPPLSTQELVWNDNKFYGESLLFDPTASGLSIGMAIEISINMNIEYADGVKQNRKENMFVEFSNFGLIHNELDTLIFVRSSQSRAWDTRPSASVMLGWKYRDQTLRCRKLSFCENICNIYKKTWNLLSPMFGVNIALLDYNKDENVEFGVGPVLSLFGGGILSGVGWNLSTPYRKNRYFFIGISFSKVVDIIKSEIGKKNTPS